ncbi:putative ML-like domain-containing protein [Seiridium cardinale]
MDRLRPGDVSPTATSPDEYRATHDVSPLSPVGEDDSHPPRRGASRRWRTFPTEYFDVSPESPPNVQREPSAGPDVRSSSVYSQDSPSRAHPDWSKDFGFSGNPRLSLQDPDSATTEQGRRLSIDSLQEVLSDAGGRKQTATAHGSSVTISSRKLLMYWNPIWLRDYFLIGLAAGCAVVAIAIFALYLVSSKTNGLGSYVGPAGLVFLWKYIPTAVIILLLALWNRVDFTARLLQPWDNLRSGPASAERSVFLDLVSSSWPLTLRLAARTGSYVPMVTIVGAVLLNIVAVLSTALLQVETVDMVDSDVGLVKTATIDATSWDPGGRDNITALRYNGIMDGDLLWPDWVLSNATVEPFEPSSTLGTTTGSSYLATVGGFFPSLECEEAKLDNKPQANNIYDPQANFNFSSDSCTLQVQLSLVDDTQTPKFAVNWAARNLMGNIQTVTCPDHTQRFLAVVTLADSNLILLESSALFCKPSYFIQNVEVTRVFLQRLPSINWDTLPSGTTQLNGLDAFELLENIVNSSSYAYPQSPDQPANTTVGNVPFLRLAAMSLTSSGSGGQYLEPFLDYGVLATQLKATFSGMASLVVNSHMLSAHRDAVTGDLQHREDRVTVKIGAAAPAITLLLACLGLAITVLYKRPQEVVPRDPRSIGGFALLLRCNPELSYHFRSNLGHLRYHLQHERFLSLLPKDSRFRFSIVREAMNPTFQPASGVAQERKNPTWWRPRTTRTWCKVLAIILPLALIGCLEGVQQVSDRSNGIVTVSSPNTAHYGFTILPAIVMWGVGIFYASINFNTVLLAPYHALSNGATPDRGLFSQDLGRLPTTQFYSALKQRHAAAACTALSVVIGPWLTIIVSGLYSTTSVDVPATVGLHQTRLPSRVEPQTLLTTSTDRETRIIQNRAPKLALQVLLGVMALCLAASWLSMRTNKLLPHNPCSIAGLAALLAGGEMWKGPDEERRGLTTPDGAEWMSDRELKRRGVWKDTVFGLGWWPDGRYGIDAGGRIDGG